MKVSHEVPRCLLLASQEFNDYDYCLPHLLDQDEEYKKYFFDAKKAGRYIVMDNSLHELGKAYDWKRLMYWLHELCPNEFIVPDEWMDYTQTQVYAKYWRGIKMPKNCTRVAVVQGKDYVDAWKSFRNLKELGYKKIAISYGATWYNDLYPHVNKDLGKALGRLTFISKLIQEEGLGVYDRIHLLGCAVPQEFGWYRDFKFIESIDTSNPVMAALEGIKYDESGLTEKPKANMNDHFDVKFTDINYEDILHNTSMFRKINGLRPYPEHTGSFLNLVNNV
jgi:hypothetical protein